MADLTDHINAVHREVGRRRIPAGDGHAVVLSRRCDATLEDVWNACTTPERLARWLAPVTGDLRAGGGYRLEGNARRAGDARPAGGAHVAADARGTILACERPSLLRVTWVHGESVTEADVSEVTLTLSARDYGATLLTLEHAAVGAPGVWERYGPGVPGVGWDLALLGLARHLDGDPRAGRENLPTTPEGRSLVTDVSQRWRAAHLAFGATAEAAERAAAETAAHFAPEG